jgi:RNA polymerase sigma-70 factor (ECF subfamily)
MENALRAVSQLDPGTQDELVQLARQGDALAWSEIYLRHYGAVYGYLFGRLGRKEDAEDLASQVFLEALKGIDRYSDRGRPLVGWLFGIARNLSNNRFRRTRLAPVESIDRDDLVDANAVSWDHRDESMDLIDSVNKLTEDQRDTIILRFYVGLSAKEAAEVLGKSEQAINALQFRAVATLRRQLLGTQHSKESLAA